VGAGTKPKGKNTMTQHGRDSGKADSWKFLFSGEARRLFKRRNMKYISSIKKSEQQSQGAKRP
jgi:hypothetical protein